MLDYSTLKTAICYALKNTFVLMLDERKAKLQRVAVVDLLRPEGVLVLAKYSAKETCF